MKGTHDLRHGVLWKQILLFALPIAATSMLQQLFNSADVAVVGQFSAQKELALAAVGSTSSIVNLYITIIFTGLAVGANVVIARLIGAEEEGEVRKAVHTSLVVAVLCGAVLMVVGECLAGPLLRWMDTPENIIHLARQYLQIYLLGAIFQMVYNFEAAILRANGDTRRPLLCLLLSGGVNVVLNLVFVLLFHMDVAGVALATVIADGVGAGLLWHYLRRETGPIRVEPALLRLDRKLLRGILYIGIPAAIQGMMFNIANVIIQSAGLGCGGGLHHWRNCGDLCLLSAQQLWPGQHDLQRPELRGGESAPVPECHPLVPAAGGNPVGGLCAAAGVFWYAVCRDLHFGRGHRPAGADADALGAAFPVVQYGH